MYLSLQLRICVEMIKFLCCNKLSIILSANIIFTLALLNNISDIDECVNHTCRNGGSCVDGVSNYSCNCKAGFTGDRCQTGAFLSCYLRSV